MKKIFSTAAMAVVALASVVTMSSCQNDSPSSFNAAPQTPATKQATTNNNNNSANTASSLTYTYKATVTNEVFSLFDVTIVRTIGSEAKTYTFTNSADMEKAMVISDKFEAAKGVHVNIKATFKVKDNYQETLNKVIAANPGKEEADVLLKACPVFKIPTLNNEIRTRNSGFGGVFIANKLTKGDLETMAEQWNDMLSVDNAK